jgi:uncharacterized protein (TIRG00374 family)
MALRSRLAKGLIKFIGPLLFLFLLLKAVNPRVAWEVFSRIRFDFVSLSLAFFPGIVWAHALRWWLTGRLVGMNVSLWRLFRVYYVGWFLGFLPPGGVAMVAKVLYLKEDGEPAGRASVSLLVDKFFDLIGTALLGLYGLFYFHETASKGSGLWLALGTGILLLALAAVRGKWLWGKARRALGKYVKRTGRGPLELLKGSNSAMGDLWEKVNLRRFLTLVFISLSLELAKGVVFIVLGMALGVGMSIPFALACRALIGLVSIIPVTIGGLGTREAVLLLTLPVAGFSRESAMALGFLSFLWNIAFHFSGVVFWLLEPVPYRSLLQFKRVGPGPCEKGRNQGLNRESFFGPGK